MRILTEKEERFIKLFILYGYHPAEEVVRINSVDKLLNEFISENPSELSTLVVYENKFKEFWRFLTGLTDTDKLKLMDGLTTVHFLWAEFNKELDNIPGLRESIESYEVIKREINNFSSEDWINKDTISHNLMRASSFLITLLGIKPNPETVILFNQVISTLNQCIEQAKDFPWFVNAESLVEFQLPSTPTEPPQGSQSKIIQLPGI